LFDLEGHGLAGPQDASFVEPTIDNQVFPTGVVTRGKRHRRRGV
jgi:hypothetical protein